MVIFDFSEEGTGNEHVAIETSNYEPSGIFRRVQHPCQVSIAHSRPQRPCFFWSAPRIATSGLVQWHSGQELHASPHIEHTPILSYPYISIYGYVLSIYGYTCGLAWSSDRIPFLNGFVNTIDRDQNQSDLSNLTLNMRRVTGSPWIADFRCWTWPEVAILGADQNERGLWGRECQ